jgi:replicative DNA helicase
VNDDEPERMPPSDIEAERWCLGGCMRSREVLAEVAELLEPGDFYRPAHGIIYERMIILFAQGIPVDPITLRADLEAERKIGVVRGAVYLADMYGDAVAVTAPAAVRYAEIIRDLSARRKVGEIGSRLEQRSQQRHEDLADLVSAAQADMAEAVMAASAARGRAGAVLDVEAFCKLDTPRMGPVIPGLLDHQDRVVLVGWEGDGKSTLAYQVAVATAAGVHPFAWTEIPPQRVMIIDLENPSHLMQVKLRKLAAVAERSRWWTPRNLVLLPAPGGVDLTRASDVMRLTDAIRVAAPDLIIAGPVYKMITDRGQGAEELHSHVTAFWDVIRERHAPALWLEAHAPGSAAGGQRQLKPMGSSIYMRWPEFGLALQRGRKGTWKLDRFRGDREEGRPWPVSLTRNTVPGGWPWAATYEHGTFLDADEGFGREAG